MRLTHLRHGIATGLRWPTLLLASAALASTWMLITTLWRGSEAQLILATAPLSVAAPSQVRDPVPNTIDVSSIQSAALFYQSRSFYIPPVVPQIQPPPDYKLVGTLIIPRQPTAAILIQPQSAARLKVRTGDDLNGWTVESIEANVVMLRHADQQFEIRAARAQALGIRRVSLPGAANEVRRPGTGIRLLGNPLE